MIEQDDEISTPTVHSCGIPGSFSVKENNTIAAVDGAITHTFD